MSTRPTDKVLVHPRLGTVHEVCPVRGGCCCSNDADGKVDYWPMTRRRAMRQAPWTHPCQSNACVKARR